MNATTQGSPRFGSSAHVLVTGVTGFLGKVVLEELLRRRFELGIARVYVLIRPRGERTAHIRFDEEVATSRCFEQLDAGWTDLVQVVSGDLCEEDCGLSAVDHDLLTARVTHIAHCAASVDFNLPITVAARSNVRTALMVLGLAKACARLTSMVSVSTAYVRPHRPGALPVEERLVPLPRPAERIYESIVAGEVDEDALLAETGHPNTYTYTKCLAEHLLVQHRGDVPLRIVRPSIISAAWKQPLRGWMDSPAAFAGFVLMIGAGYLKNVVGDMRTRLDVVPVDAVADRILGAVFEPHAPEATAVDIRHAVVGLDHAFSIAQARYGITGFFSEHPVDRPSTMHYIGPRDPLFQLLDVLDHKAPTALAGAISRLQGKTRQAKRVQRLADRLDYINRAFPYFTSHTFDFDSSVPFEAEGFTTDGYVRVVCEGAYRYILGHDPREMTIAGRAHRSPQGDLAWATDRTRRDVNETIRGLGYVLRKTARRSFDRVTFDKPAFEAALAAVPPDAIPVVVPTHRSYADFLLCSYLFFERPDLGVSLPYIAAAEEFGNIRLLGKVLSRGRAFYLRRGRGQKDPALTRQVQDLVDRKATLQFFIEGKRSRARRFLPPRRGLLRCLQSTGSRFAILPVALSYERLPEEEALLRELQGQPKARMRLRALARWASKMASGEVQLGRVHASCGAPVILDAAADVHAVGAQVMAELQAHTVVTDFHLRAFLHHHPGLGMDLATLTRHLRARGMRVLTSDLADAEMPSVQAERCMRHQWEHAFFGDLLARHGTNPIVAAHVADHRFVRADATEAPQVPGAFLDALAAPRVYALDRTADVLRGARPGTAVTARDVVQRSRDLHLPDAEAALALLAEVGVVTQTEAGAVRGPAWADLTGLEARCGLRPRGVGRAAAYVG